MNEMIKIKMTIKRRNYAVMIKGFMGGNVYTDNGGPANYLCLPEDPTWAKYQDGFQG
jgi:hypothetical protein